MLIDTLFAAALFFSVQTCDTIPYHIETGLEYHRTEYVKKIEFGPDYFYIVSDYIFNEHKDKYWFRKYKLTIRF